MSIDWEIVVGAPCVAVFGEPATYLSAAGAIGELEIEVSPVGGVASYDIIGVFDEGYTEKSFDDNGMQITTAMPVFSSHASAFASPPAQDDQIVIARTGNTYIVREVRPDSHGIIKLMLNLVSP